MRIFLVSSFLISACGTTTSTTNPPVGPAAATGATGTAGSPGPTGATNKDDQTEKPVEFDCSGTITCTLTTEDGPQGSKKIILDERAGECGFAEPTDRRSLVIEGENLTLDGDIIGNVARDKNGYPTSMGYDFGNGLVQLSSCKPS